MCCFEIKCYASTNPVLNESRCDSSLYSVACLCDEIKSKLQSVWTKIVASCRAVRIRLTLVRKQQEDYTVRWRLLRLGNTKTNHMNFTCTWTQSASTRRAKKQKFWSILCPTCCIDRRQIHKDAHRRWWNLRLESKQRIKSTLRNECIENSRRKQKMRCLVSHIRPMMERTINKYVQLC